MEFSCISGKVYSEPLGIENLEAYSEPWHSRTFLYLWKGIFRTLAYLELEAYSEPWYTQNSRIFRIPDIFKTL